MSLPPLQRPHARAHVHIIGVGWRRKWPRVSSLCVRYDGASWLGGEVESSFKTPTYTCVGAGFVLSLVSAGLVGAANWRVIIFLPRTFKY